MKMGTLIYLLFIFSCLNLSLSWPAADLDQIISVTEREPVFRKDYSLDKNKRIWYKFHRSIDTWYHARERCQLEGAKLASPINTDILNVMVEKMKDSSELFIGVHSLFNDGDYYSLEGVPIADIPVKYSYTDSQSDEGCTILTTDRETTDTVMTNKFCEFAFPYICYKNNDYTPLTECGTIDKEYVYNKELSTCYKLHANGSTWKDAFKICSAEGGHLVVINSDAEWEVVKEIISNATRDASKNAVLVGTIDSSQYFNIRRNKWITIHDTPLTKLKKTTSFISAIEGGTGSCGSLTSTGIFRGVGCRDTDYPFLCEKKPGSLITINQLNDLHKPEITSQ